MADTIVVPNEGEIDELTTVKANTTIKLGLFKSSVTPSASSVLADFTSVVADFSGYSSIGPATLSFGSVTTNGSGQATMTASPVVFTHNGGATNNTVFGHYIYNSVTSKLLKAVLWDTTFAMDANGKTITVTTTELLAGTLL